MNILQVNKFYYPKGGSEAYLFSIEKELAFAGHKTVPFSMHDEKNKVTPWNRFFIQNVDYAKAHGFLDQARLAMNIIYSFEARKQIANLLDAFTPDIAHLHIFQHQLSPSIITELKSRRIPILYTAHDLKSVCPNYKMLTHDGVCERCNPGRYYNAVRHRCVKDSVAKSMVNCVEMYFHDWVGFYDDIDMVVTPSRFYREKILDFGRFSADKIVHIPNFVDDDGIAPCYSNEGYFLYFGRLSEEKGIMTLVEAMKGVQGQLRIAGTGPCEQDIRNLIDANNLDNIELVGFQTGEKLHELIKGAQFTVLPSEWYENGSIALLESLAYGKPVVGADIGGIPEHIETGKTGYLFPAKDSEALCEVLNKALQDDLEKMGRNARKSMEDRFSKKHHMTQLFKAYAAILKEQ